MALNFVEKVLYRKHICRVGPPRKNTKIHGRTPGGEVGWLELHGGRIKGEEVSSKTERVACAQLYIGCI